MKYLYEKPIMENMQDFSFGVVGMGRLGTALARKLMQTGGLIWVVGHTLKSIDACSFLSGLIPVFYDIRQIERIPDFFLLSVTDPQIEPVAVKIAERFGDSLSGKFVVHFSGVHRTDILESCEKFGAETASLHPYQTFYKYHDRIFDDIFWGCEAAKNKGKILALISLLGGKAVFLSEGTLANKALYHSSAVAASNFANAALNFSKLLAAESGISSSEFLPPIIRQSIENSLGAISQGNTFSLTGPISRGDSEIIRKHLDSLSSNPAYRRIYACFSAATCELAYHHGFIGEPEYTEIMDLCRDYFNALQL